MDILIINRIVAGIIAVIFIIICEKFKIPPFACFILAIIYLMLMTFIFEIIKELIK